MKIRIKKSDLQARRSVTARGLKKDQEVPDSSADRVGGRDYHSLFDGLYHAVLIVEDDNCVHDANRRAEEFFAGERAEMAGIVISDLIHGMDDSMMAKLRSNIDNGRYTVLNGTCIRLNGDKFAAEISLSGMESGGKRSIVFAIRNESRVDSIKSQLRTEHNALQNAASAIALSDLEYDLNFINKAFIDLWGFENESAAASADIRKLWMDASSSRQLWERPRAGEKWSGELLALKRDASPFWVQCMSAPNRDETGQVMGIVFSFVDISERREAEESIRKEVEGQIDQARGRDDFAGLLNIIRLEDIFQLIDSTKKNGELVIRDESARELARIYFLDGSVVSANAEDRRDHEAILHVLRDGGHSFEFKSGSGDFPRRMRESTTAILLDLSRRLDEEN